MSVVGFRQPTRVPAPGYNATIAERTDLTEALAFFRIRPDGAAKAFAPGQYVTLGLDTGERVVERPYSIASSAERLDDGYELYVRLVPNGALTPSLFRTRAGERVMLRAPKGRFTLQPGDERIHLFIATGCGIAPFISMLRTLNDTHAVRPIVLIHGVSYVRELAYRLFLEDLAGDAKRRFTYVPTISRPLADENLAWPGSTGRAEAIIASVCDRLLLAPANCVAYVCGNPEMTSAARHILGERGFDRAQVRVEEYWPPARRDAPAR